MTITIESMVTRWAGRDRPLFKGRLINSKGCRCAQGDVLHCSGVSDDELRTMTRRSVDTKVAEVLDISVTHSILLRQVNDKADGCPGDVLIAPEKILGPEAKRILAFWKRLDGNKDAFLVAFLNADLTASWYERDAFREGACDAGCVAAGEAAREAAGNAIRDSDGSVAWEAFGATAEIQGHSLLESPLFFLPLFGINAVTDLD